MSKLAVTIDGQRFEIEAVVAAGCVQGCAIRVGGVDVSVAVPETGTSGPRIEWMIIDGRPYELTFDEELRWIRAYSGIHTVDVQDLEARVFRPRSGDGRLKAPIPGLVTRILVKEGETVRADQPIIVLEAMKMENEIRAPFDGKVLALAVSEGETVARNAVLVEIGQEDGR
jgi:acetyl/propionyl-CoA carboxylase alpha subunit